MFRKSSKYPVLFAVIALVCLTAGIVSAATVTQNITYQGKLTDGAGNPLTGKYLVTFRIYPTSTSALVLSTDTHGVTATNGLFTTSIHIVNPSVVQGGPLWLGIRVESDPEMTPRQEIRPVPFALSLRPGALIASTESSPALLLKNTGGGEALNISTTKDESHGAVISTAGAMSPGVMVLTDGDRSEGVHITTRGAGEGMVINALHGIGLNVTTIGMEGDGGVVVNSSHGYGVSVTTSGFDGDGVVINTADGNGVHITTEGWDNDGIEIHSYGQNAMAVNAYSDTTAIWAQTNKPDNKYGVQTPDIIRALSYETGASDVAEYMPVMEETGPGTVLIIGSDGRLRSSATAYDTRVAGIVSTDPGVALGAEENGNDGEAPVAVAGRVPCKVDATYGAIHPGDMLTSSSTPGYAMKAEKVTAGTVSFYLPGTILGKAMGTLESGTGTIEVLVTLQ